MLARPRGRVVNVRFAALRCPKGRPGPYARRAMTGDGKAAAALQAQAQNFAEQTRVYEDWNKKLRDVVVQERERRVA